MLSAILAKLQAQCPSFEVIAEAPGGDAITTADAFAASSALKTLLESAVGAAYPLLAPETKTPPDAIYTLVSARPVEVDGVRVSTAATFIVTLRATGYPALVSQLSAVESAVTASSDAISITDAAFDHDEKRNYYLADIELTYAVPSVAGGNNWPAILVDVEQFKGRESLYDNATRQRVDRAYGFTILSTSNNLKNLREEVQAAVLGQQQTPACFEFQFQVGNPLSLPGGLYAWRDIYQDAVIIS